MKVAYISDWNPRYNSGVGTVITGCVKAGATYGWEPVLVGPSFQGCWEEDGVWLPSLGIGRGYRVVLTLLPEVDRDLTRVFEEVDIVHLHSISPITIRALGLLSRMESRPSAILHLHTQAGAYLTKWLGRCAGPAVTWVNKTAAKCCRQADLVISPTDFFAELAEREYPLAKKPLVWSAPIEVPVQLPPVTRQELLSCGSARLPDDAKLIYYIGRIVVEKNIEFLIEAMKQIRDENVCLVLAGDGDFRKYQRAMPASLCRRVSFLGYVDRPVALAYCHYAQLGITASITEVQGLGLLEQMAMGLPVLAPLNTCFDQPILGSKGGEILPLEPGTWAKTIEVMLGDQHALRRMGQRGKEYVDHHYSVKQYSRLDRIYIGLQSARLLTGLVP